MSEFSLKNIRPDAENPRLNPQRKNIVVQKLSRAPWWLLIILAGVLIFVISVMDSRTYQEAWREIRQGIWTTIWVTVVAYALALLMGLILALLRRPSKSLIYNIFIYQPATVFVELIRGIPTLVLVFYITLALVPQLVIVGNGIGRGLLEDGYELFGISEWMASLIARDIPTVYRAIMALAISYSAFLSEIFRAGLDSVGPGQREAARSLGMTQWQIMRFIVLPQAIRNILPALGNDFIAMLKESSLVSIVGVKDITRAGQTYAAATFTFFQAFNLVAVTYLVLTLSLSMLVKLLEIYLDRGKNQD